MGWGGVATLFTNIIKVLVLGRFCGSQSWDRFSFGYFLIWIFLLFFSL